MKQIEGTQALSDWLQSLRDQNSSGMHEAVFQLGQTQAYLLLDLESEPALIYYNDVFNRPAANILRILAAQFLLGDQLDADIKKDEAATNTLLMRLKESNQFCQYFDLEKPQTVQRTTINLTSEYNASLFTPHIKPSPQHASTDPILYIKAQIMRSIKDKAWPTPNSQVEAPVAKTSGLFGMFKLSQHKAKATTTNARSDVTNNPHRGR